MFIGSGIFNICCWTVAVQLTIWHTMQHVTEYWEMENEMEVWAEKIKYLILFLNSSTHERFL